MTISTATNRYTYTGNGSTVAFAFSSKFFAATDILVYVNGVLQTVGYTVTGAGVDAGGTVTFSIAPVNGASIVLDRAVPFTSAFDPQDGEALPAINLENAIDRGVVLASQASSVGSRSLQIPVTDTAGTTVLLPAAAARANKACIFDATGSVTVSTDDYDDQAAAAAASALSASNSATTATTQAGLAAAAKTAAEAAQTGAEVAEAATEALLSAAQLPDPPVADTFILRNSTNTAYDPKTVAQVSALIGPAMADGTAAAPSMSFESDPNTGLYHEGTDIIGVSANGVKIAAFGKDDIILAKRMTNTAQPAFYALKTSTSQDVTGDGTYADVVYDSELNDQASNYDNSTGVFTAPVSGFYRFSGTVGFLTCSSNHTGGIVLLVTSNRSHVIWGGNPYAVQYSYGGDYWQIHNFDCLTYMDAGDTAKVQAYVVGGSKTVDVTGSAVREFFSGMLVA